RADIFPVGAVCAALDRKMAEVHFHLRIPPQRNRMVGVEFGCETIQHDGKHRAESDPGCHGRRSIKGWAGTSVRISAAAIQIEPRAAVDPGREYACAGILLVEIVG